MDAGDREHLPVIDAHTHLFPQDVIADRVSFFKRDLWFELLYTNPKAMLVDASDLILSMDVAGIDRAIVAGFPWKDAGLCRLHNDYMADVCGSSNGRLSWLGIVSPISGTEAVREAGRCFELGASGLGELNADAQGFEVADASVLTSLFELCAIRNRPIMVHASEPVGHHYPGKGKSTPDRLVAMIESFPEVSFVLAHWGGGLPFFELMPEIGAIMNRVVYDTAASTYLYRWQVFRSALDIVGKDRVLFATDFPILRQDRFVAKAASVDWKDEAERRAVLCDNARRVYNLSD